MITLPPEATPAVSEGRMLTDPYRRLFISIKAELAPSTGWAAPTGTASRATFDTATVTTAQLAQRVKALIDDLTAQGRLKG